MDGGIDGSWQKYTTKAPNWFFSFFFSFLKIPNFLHYLNWQKVESKFSFGLSDSITQTSVYIISYCSIYHVKYMKIMLSLFLFIWISGEENNGRQPSDGNGRIFSLVLFFHFSFLRYICLIKNSSPLLGLICLLIM